MFHVTVGVNNKNSIFFRNKWKLKKTHQFGICVPNTLLLDTDVQQWLNLIVLIVFKMIAWDNSVVTVDIWRGMSLTVSSKFYAIEFD